MFEDKGKGVVLKFYKWYPFSNRWVSAPFQIVSDQDRTVCLSDLNSESLVEYINVYGGCVFLEQLKKKKPDSAYI